MPTIFKQAKQNKTKQNRLLLSYWKTSFIRFKPKVNHFCILNCIDISIVYHRLYYKSRTHTYCICGRVVSRIGYAGNNYTYTYIYTYNKPKTSKKQKKTKSNNKKCIKHTKNQYKILIKKKYYQKKKKSMNIFIFMSYICIIKFLYYELAI